MKKSHRALLLALATLLFLLLTLVACSSDNTEVFYCNVSKNDFGLFIIEEKPKSQASYRGERTYDKDGMLVSCLIKEKYTNCFAYELTYNPDGTIVKLTGSYEGTFEYNEKGLCVGNDIDRYEYDAEGRCIKSYTYAEKDAKYKTYSYNENGQLSEIAIYKNGEKKSSTFYCYDQNGNITEKYGQQYLSEEEANRPKVTYSTLRTVYEYQNSKLAKITEIATVRTIDETHDETHDEVRTIREYDENGNEIKFIDKVYAVYNIDEIGKCIISNEYQYDDRGNPIKKSVYAVHEEKGFRQLMLEAVITYDQNDNPTSNSFSFEGTPIFKAEYKFTKDDICTKSVVTHSNGNAVLEHNGYASAGIMGDIYSIFAYDQYGQITKELFINSDSGEILYGAEYEYDNNGERIKSTCTVTAGYTLVREANKDSIYTPEGQLILTAIFNQNDAENVTVYDAENNVIFEAEEKWIISYRTPLSHGIEFSDGVLEYSIYLSNSRPRQHVYFRYENGTLRVETE